MIGLLHLVRYQASRLVASCPVQLSEADALALAEVPTYLGISRSPRPDYWTSPVRQVGSQDLEEQFQQCMNDILSREMGGEDGNVQ